MYLPCVNHVVIVREVYLRVLIMNIGRKIDTAFTFHCHNIQLVL